MANNTWIAFANAQRCNHYRSLKERGFINWRKSRTNFQIGDIVYLFSSVERRIIYKAIVVGTEIRQDGDYWIEKPNLDETWRLEAVAENIGNKLSEEDLKENGFNGGRSLQHPICNNRKLIDYIKSIL